MTAASGTLIRKIQRQDADLDQPAADERPDRRGDAAEPGPGPDRPGPVLAARTTAWIIARLPGVSSAPPTPCRTRAAISSRRSGRARRAARPARTRPTPTTKTRRRPNRSPSAPPSRISDGQREHVAVDDPLQRGEAGVEVLADRRQRDVDDGPVEAGHARAEDGREQHPATARGAVADLLGAGAGGHVARPARQDAPPATVPAGGCSLVRCSSQSLEVRIIA